MAGQSRTASASSAKNFKKCQRSWGVVYCSVVTTQYWLNTELILSWISCFPPSEGSLTTYKNCPLNLKCHLWMVPKIYSIQIIRNQIKRLWSHSVISVGRQRGRGDRLPWCSGGAAPPCERGSKQWQPKWQKKLCQRQPYLQAIRNRKQFHKGFASIVSFQCKEEEIGWVKTLSSGGAVVVQRHRVREEANNGN